MRDFGKTFTLIFLSVSMTASAIASSLPKLDLMDEMLQPVVTNPSAITLPLERFNVQAGDKIIEVNGDAVNHFQAIEELLMASSDEDIKSVSVLRGGEKVKVYGK